MPSILFVCTANQFRSPIAAACFKSKLETLDWKSPWYVNSAGTWAQPGRPALPVAVSVGQRLGVSLLEHSSQPVTPALVSIQDLILVMEHGHREALRAEFQIFAARIHLLSEVAIGKAEDIIDPVGGIENKYWETALKIRDMIETGFYRICAKAMRTRNIG